ncbi:exodeoxyribonuclease VII large subunit [Inhella gelatinilytica]|uniref:Exodeoxyribonuclease 7 large subunit n=1 Tax=Inhella gelatinilytica TaxID=2795030 RepID=A0A931J250_9BURK|nr:exodeoxyribonuclease VII large subunit [Inhella gelatinilytica]MBH9554093.1 exodeoxyribonuclease VII large subunit [Inhella gelatinilytica]
MIPSTGSQAWSVAALLAELAHCLTQTFGVVTVEGELATFTRAASGHCYFSLKDASGAPALLRCALFRRAAQGLRFVPQEGQRVRVWGRLALYEPRGELQFIAEGMEPAGAGALYEQFLRLKAQLEEEGLFDPAHKRPLPRFPRSLGLITSASGAAVHDVCSVLARRAPHVSVVIYPSIVQGAEAPAQLLAALRLAEQRSEVDALLLVRGGGSMEDLWAFNDPELVRAVARCSVPVISGVGHETDVTLCDWAADVRAATPTAAAELAAGAQLEWLNRVDHLAASLAVALRGRLDHVGQRLDRAAVLLARPRLQRPQQRLLALQHRLRAAVAQRHRQEQERLNAMAHRLPSAVRGPLGAGRLRLARAQASLEALNPQRVLARGFAWLEGSAGQPLVKAAELRRDERISARLADGRATLRVEEITLPDAQVELGF